MDESVELERLRARVAQLESLVERLASTQVANPRHGDPFAPPAGMDRRRMLRKGLGLSVAAVAGVGVADALGSSAAAATDDAVLVGQSVAPSQVSDPPTRIYNAATQTMPPLLFLADNTNAGIPDADIPTDLTIGLAGRTGGLYPIGNTQVGVYGITNHGTGVRGDATSGVGVTGRATLGPGVLGHSAQDNGIRGETDHSGSAGVLGLHTDGIAVLGLSQTDTGVGGGSDSGIGVDGGSTSGIGARGQSDTADGVCGISQSAAGVSATSTTGPGLTATSSSGTAIAGSSGTGVGAQLQGGAAALRLVPQQTAGHPTTGHHARGELLVDSSGRPWLCTKQGTPGTWRQIAFV